MIEPHDLRFYRGVQGLAFSAASEENVSSNAHADACACQQIASIQREVPNVRDLVLDTDECAAIIAICVAQVAFVH